MLRLSRYSFHFTALDEIRLPAFAGSALRGLFGHGLRRTACITNLESCNGCSLRHQCSYTQLFEAQLASTGKGMVLQPLVMSLDQYAASYRPGECFGLEMTLIGKANRHLPYLIPAWQRAGQRGLGKAQARFALAEVRVRNLTDQSASSIYSQAEGLTAMPVQADLWHPTLDSRVTQVELRFITPYRAKKDKQLVTPANFEPRGLLIGLIRRIETLRAQHDPDSPTLDIQRLLDAAARVTMPKAELRWTEVKRYSSRQQTEMQLDGITGDIQFSGTGLAPLYPLLELGQWLHLGKNTLFGLGQYRIHNPATS